jgi:hypothetical protein
MLNWIRVDSGRKIGSIQVSCLAASAWLEYHIDFFTVICVLHCFQIMGAFW